MQHADAKRSSAPADIDLQRLADRGPAPGPIGEPRGATQIFADDHGRILLLGHLQQAAGDVHGIAGGGDVLIMRRAEPRHHGGPEMPADAGAQPLAGDRRQDWDLAVRDGR